MKNPAFPYAKEDQDLFFIGEIGSNHNNNKNRLFNLIFSAKHAGCDAVKLQFYDPKYLWESEDKKKEAYKTAIDFDFLKQASLIAKDLKIGIGCSIFDKYLVEQAASCMDFLKISSFECLWFDLVKAARRMNKPLFISTGMCSAVEIYQVTRTATPQSNDALFHCCSMYPSTIENSRFNILERMINTYQYGNYYSYIGYSDHTKLPGAIYAAVALGTNIIECHIDLYDLGGNESQHGHCWIPKELKPVIKDSKDLRKAMPKKEENMDNFTDRPDRENLKFRTNPKTGMRS